MRTIAPPHHLPLAKGWPCRARSAVVQAISLSQFALILAQSWAAHSLNARYRLQAERDRVRHVLTLLRKELRLKDARMEQTCAPRQPHYPPTERLAILERRAGHVWFLSQTAR